ncbi:MAG: site-specific integrase [Actinobacteria bacterium]|nr:site-specific integrase [Actinomycetota bacterium]
METDDQPEDGQRAPSSDRAHRRRRSYGTGSLEVRRDKKGVETWYGLWYAHGRRIKRRVGPKRDAGTRRGLTRAQAEAELRRMTAETRVVARPTGERLSVAEVSSRYVAHAERRGRKLSTRLHIESETRVHLVPFFGDRALDSIDSGEVLDLIGRLEGKGLKPNSIRNIVGTLSALFNFGRAPQRGWATRNPCEGVELPATPERNEVRFLTLDEVYAAIANARPGPFQVIDRTLYLAAATTGLRKGELVALRWLDVDLEAGRIRVRRNFVCGEFGTPKSRRSSRSVPMTQGLQSKLRRLRRISRFSRDQDLVFGHPETGEPLAKANVTRRFRASLKAARLDDSHRFHDLRHTFGTRAAGTGVPMRTLQEWMGHRDLTTTQIYADYSPNAAESEMVARAFGR